MGLGGASGCGHELLECVREKPELLVTVVELVELVEWWGR